METKTDLNSVYCVSQDVVARDVCGEFMIIPIASGIGDSDDKLFSLNKFGIAIWNKLDGKKNLKKVAEELNSEFKGPKLEIENDVLGFTKELLKRKMIIKL